MWSGSAKIAANGKLLYAVQKIELLNLNKTTNEQ